jgi:hypothetical protein
MGFTACGSRRNRSDELITPVYLKQVIMMLLFHIPLRSFRYAIQRYSQFRRVRTTTTQVGPGSEKTEQAAPDGPAVQENQKQNSAPKSRPSRALIFFLGVCRAMSIGLFVAFILAAAPWFEPDIQPFQTRLADFIQQYAIPICSALLIWYGLRSAL